MLIFFPENYYFVLYEYMIGITHLLKGYGSRVFAANFAS